MAEEFVSSCSRGVGVSEGLARYAGRPCEADGSNHPATDQGEGEGAAHT